MTSSSRVAGVNYDAKLGLNYVGKLTFKGMSLIRWDGIYSRKGAISRTSLLKKLKYWKEKYKNQPWGT